MKKIIYAGLINMIFLCGMNEIAHANIITFNDRANWESLVGVTSTENFDSFLPGTSFLGTALDTGDFSIFRTGPASVYSGYISNNADLFNINGTNYGRVDTVTNFDLIFTFDTAITAFGLDVKAWNDGLIRTTVMADNSINVPVTSQVDQGSRFFGFTSDTAFTTVTFVGGIGDSWGFDNVSYGGTPIPEPATMLLMGTGLVGLAGSRIRRKKKA